MAGRAYPPRLEPGPSMPAFDRLAPPPPADVVGARIDGLTSPGDVVVDLHARGGWIARAAVDRQRRAITIESTPLTRLLAEVVLRPPDLRHLDAAFQAMAASPRRDTSLKLWIGERFATRCATCERSLVLDELVWEAGDDGVARPTNRHYRCSLCRSQRGGGELRHGPPDADDAARSADDGGEDALAARRAILDRFPPLDGDEALAEALVGIHTPRQLIGLAAILERIEGDLRAAPIEAALRLALLHALLPASRLNAYPGRVMTLRLAGRTVRGPGSGWRERNPWVAFEDAFRGVRAFIQRIEAGSHGPVQARFGDDLRALLEGTAAVSVRVATPTVARHFASEARDAARVFGPTGARLILSQPPLRQSADRVAFAYLATAWALGREAAALLPLESLVDPPGRIPWGWQAAALSRSLRAAEPLLARDGRAVLVCDPAGPEPVVAAALGGAGAGYRLASARLADPGEDASLVELVPPGAALPPGPRTRANVSLAPVPGGPGDPDLVPGRGLFAPPERFDQRPFSVPEAARTVTDTAVEVLRARGEPARTERLLGEILVGLDRAGHLRRLIAGSAGAPAEARGDAGAGGGRPGDEAGGHPTGEPPRDPARPASEELAARSDRAPASADASMPAVGVEAPELWSRRRDASAAGQVERLLALIHEELGRPGHRRLVEIEPDRWWLADRADREAAAVPLADRVEWAVFSLLSTGGPLAEPAFLERIAALFGAHDLPDETLVRACLESYRSLASTPDQLVCSDDLVRRTEEHSELLALLADLGHRLGMAVWLSRREQERLFRRRRLSDWLEPREQRVHLPLIARAPLDELAEVDAIWYVRGRAVLHFEVEWTAMLSDAVLRRHARIPGDDTTVRFLVIVPERTELLRYKLERSPVLRAAMEDGNWHILKAHHLRAFAALETPTLDALEPFLGLDPLVERSAEQLPLFGA